MTKRNLYAGYKLRFARKRLGLTQKALAAGLGISTSYLNQIERDQRPITARVLAALTAYLDVPQSYFDMREEARLVDDLAEILEDPFFSAANYDHEGIREALRAAPVLGREFLHLYQSHQTLRRQYETLAEQLSLQRPEDGVGLTRFPYESVRDLIQDWRNYIDPLDRRAERLFTEEGFSTTTLQDDLTSYLGDRHDVTVRVCEQQAARLYDPERRTLSLSKDLDPPGRAFQLAYQLGLIEEGRRIRALVERAQLGADDSRAIAHIAFANYFAGALLMPYDAFRAEASSSNHDILHLQRTFGVSFEQACHRLSTLQRPRCEGVPFFFFRVDIAGNLSKQFSANSFRFARFGGICPIWNVHECFATMGRLVTQIVEMPDGATYFTLARAVEKSGMGYTTAGRRYAIGLGCEIEHADRLAYSRHLDLTQPEAAPAGKNCRVCARPDCTHRAFPPIGRMLAVDLNRRDVIPYRFGV